MARSYLRLYGSLARTAIATQFQYRVSNYLYMIGMIVEPVIYLVVWSSIAEQQGGEVGGYTPETFAAYYIVWTLVRNMNIVFTPFGWEERIREGELSAHLVRPIHPIHYDLGSFAGWKLVVIVLWLPIAAVLTIDLPTRPRPDRSTGGDVRGGDLGRLPDPLAVAVGARDDHVLDDPRERHLRGLLRRRAVAVGAARARAR